MDEEERPRKLPKLDQGETREDLEPAMTGAVGGAATREAEAMATGSGDESPAPNDENAGATDTQKPSGDGEGGEAAPKMSKNQLKKLRRQERWDAAKDQRRVKRREKSTEKRRRKREELEEAKQAGTADELLKTREAERKRVQNSILLPVTFVIDCSYDDLMLDKERKSLSSQITRSYSDNSRAPFRSHLVVSSFEKLLKERFDTTLEKNYQHWKGIRFMQEDYVHTAEKAKEWMQSEKGGQMAGVFTDKGDAKPEDGEVVYLSSESPHTLTELKPYSTYIIGGLVDKNRHKGVCYKSAVGNGVKTARLPIGDYIQMDSRQVLTTNHVVEIMVRWLELGDWGKAFMQVLPQRKGGMLRGQEQEQQEEQEEQEQAEAN